MPAPRARPHRSLVRGAAELARDWPAFHVNRAFHRPSCFLRLLLPPQPAPSPRVPGSFPSHPLPSPSQRPSRYRESRLAATGAGCGAALCRFVVRGKMAVDSPPPSPWPGRVPAEFFSRLVRSLARGRGGGGPLGLFRPLGTPVVGLRGGSCSSSPLPRPGGTAMIGGPGSFVPSAVFNLRSWGPGVILTGSSCGPPAWLSPAPGLQAWRGLGTPVHSLYRERNARLARDPRTFLKACFTVNLLKINISLGYHSRDPLLLLVNYDFLAGQSIAQSRCS